MSLSDQQWCPTSAQVTVLQARGLRIKGKGGTNDAYAVMQVGKEKYQTSVAEKCVAPVWKEEAAFDLPQLQQAGGGGGGGTERSTLHVSVLHRALVGPDKLLGQAVINLLLLSEDKTRNKTEWFKLLDKTGKADKDRGEVLVDIQFMRNNMTASMFDLSGAGKSRSRLGKFKDKVRGKKKEQDTVSTIMPAFTQVLTDSEEEGHGEEEAAAGKDEKKKKHKMKSLFSPKSNLQKNMSQSMSVLPAKNSSLSGSQSSGLNVDSSEGKKKFKFKIHKRSGSSDSKESSSGHQKQGAAEQSNLCINGSHIYCEEPPPRTSRIGSNFSLASSGHGSMEDVPESSPPSVDSLRAVRQYSPWTEEEEEETAEKENLKEDELRREEEERVRIEEERRRKEEEEERVRRQEAEAERLAEEKRRLEEEEERWRIKEEEKRQREEEERIRMEEEMARRKEEERKLAEEKRRQEEERRIEEERARKEEEERIQREEEERRRREEEERVRRDEEERERLAEKKRLEEEARRIEEEEKRQREEEERIRMEEERAEKERRRQEEEERARREEEERERLAVEKRRLEEEEERRRIEEEEKRQREEEERVRMEEERVEKERRQEEEHKLAEEKRRLEEEERKRIEEEKVREEEEERIRREEERRRQEEEEMLRRQEEEREEKRRLEEQERRRRENEERIRKEEEEKAEREKEEFERLLEEKRKREEEERKRKEEEEKIRKEEEERERMRQQEEEENVRRQLAAEKRMLEEQERRRIEEEEEKRQREEQERIRKEEEEETARKEREENERLLEEKMRQEELKRRRIEEEERIRQEEEDKIRMEEERRRKQEEEQKRIIEEEEKTKREEEERIRREKKAEEEARKQEKEKAKRAAKEQKKKENEPKHKAAEVTSTNPFDEDFSTNPFEESPDSPAEPDSSTASTVQQRSQSAAASTDEKDLLHTQREKRPAPQPPGRNQAERQSQDGSARHLAQVNKQSKEKDVKTVSVPPQRSVQMIAPLSRSEDAKNIQSSTQSSANKETTSIAKHSKRPAPTRPGEEGPKTALSSGSEAKQKQVVYSLNPFEGDEDEDELTAQDNTTTTGSVQWPPAVSQAAASQAKIKSSKTARAPSLPATTAATSSTLMKQNTEGGHVIDDTRETVRDNPSDPNNVQETPLQDSKPATTVQSTGEEASGQKEGPPTASRRLQPVKPLNPLGQQQSVSVVQGETDNKSTGIQSEVQKTTKVDDTGLKGPYSQLTREELISLVRKQETQLSQRDKKISELELYIDNLLVRVMEEKPSILMSMNALK